MILYFLKSTPLDENAAFVQRYAVLAARSVLPNDHFLKETGVDTLNPKAIEDAINAAQWTSSGKIKFSELQKKRYTGTNSTQLLKQDSKRMNQKRAHEKSKSLTKNDLTACELRVLMESAQANQLNAITILERKVGEAISSVNMTVFDKVTIDDFAQLDEFIERLEQNIAKLEDLKDLAEALTKATTFLPYNFQLQRFIKACKVGLNEKEEDDKAIHDSLGDKKRIQKLYKDKKIFTPQGKRPNKPKTIVLALHGMGRNGTYLTPFIRSLNFDSENVLVLSLEAPYPFYKIIEVGKQWANIGSLQAPDDLKVYKQIKENIRPYIRQLVQDLKKEYGDRVNFRIIGGSQGAIVALDAVTHIEEITQAIAIAGAFRDIDGDSNIMGKKVYLIHSGATEGEAKDEYVPFARAQEAHRELLKCNKNKKGIPGVVTLEPDGAYGHDVIDDKVRTHTRTYWRDIINN